VEDESSVFRLASTRLKARSARVRNTSGINRVLLRISIWYSCQFAGFHVANRAVTRSLTTAQMCEAF